jgi:type IV pilus assembly protein PilZ
MSSSPPPSERRRGARTPIELKVEYRRLNTFFADYTKNISRGGTFIATDRPLPEGTEFIFALGIPNMEEPLRLTGRVCWIVKTESATKANPAGMGIEFLFTGHEDRRAIERTVEKLMVDELGEHIVERLLNKKLDD